MVAPLAAVNRSLLDLVPGLSLAATSGVMESFTTDSELAVWANEAPPALEHMMRSNSSPPAWLAALAGTMNGSPAPDRMAVAGILSPVIAGIAMTAMSKPSGVAFNCSFSSHEPHG